ncbi:hypothetical protein Tco_0850865 [Tanacetum coccineum]
MRQNLIDSHLEGKPPRRDSNLRPLACGNNIPKDTLANSARFYAPSIGASSGTVSVLEAFYFYENSRTPLVDSARFYAPSIGASSGTVSVLEAFYFYENKVFYW